MNENDLRDCFAMFAMAGLVMREGVIEKSGLEIDAWVMADRMIETRSKNFKEPETGIVAVKRVRKTSEKRDA
jgi:hypothetical protein